MIDVLYKKRRAQRVPAEKHSKFRLNAHGKSKKRI
jgi:hypothetical protein